VCTIKTDVKIPDTFPTSGFTRQKWTTQPMMHSSLAWNSRVIGDPLDFGLRGRLSPDLVSDHLDQAYATEPHVFIAMSLYELHP
jgi:hypothetical protein